MTDFSYLLFNQSPEQLRRIGSRGGKAQARNRRARLLTHNEAQPCEAVFHPLPQTPTQAIDRSSILALLLPSRATLNLATRGSGRPLGAFLAAVALRGDLPLAGATWARRGATRAFLLGFGFLLLAVVAAVVFSSGINVVILFSP